MEPASALPEMPPFEDTLRTGQADIVRRFLSEQSCIARLPTGYGKTRAAAAAYLTLRLRNLVNRCLYVVPRGAQATQAAEDLPRDLLKLGGLHSAAFIVGASPIPALKAHRAGQSEIFISTVQALGDSPRTIDAIAELMQTGRWMLVIDEYHHYADDDAGKTTSWTARIKRLSHQAFLAMSATPTRLDGGSPFGSPDVDITYRQAWKEETVKELQLHVYDYRIDAIIGGGDVIQFTTKELFEAAGSEEPADIEKMLTSRNMKWSPRFISPLITHPVARMNSLLAVDGIRSQMLVQALSCSHAKSVCEQIQGLLEGFRVDWVGTGPSGRSDAENAKILREFCPPKDDFGRRNWTLDVLVNVGMAGEGLDCIDVSEVVFLTSPRLNNTTLQAIGRGARVMSLSKEKKQPVCTINVDGSSEIHEYLGEKIMDAFDGVEPEELSNPSDADDNEREFGELPDNLDHIRIFNVELINIRKHPAFADILPQVEAKVHQVNPAQDREWVREEALRIAEEALRKVLERTDAVFNASALLKLKRDALERGLRVVVFEFQRLSNQINGVSRRSSKDEFRDLIRRIKSRKNREIGSIPENASNEELDLHQAWLARLQRAIRAREIPTWLL